MYRLVRIKGIVDDRNTQPYMLVSQEGPNSKKLKTRIEFICQYGNLEKKMKLTLISNSDPSSTELVRYVRSCNEQKYQLPSRNDLHAKLQEVSKLKTGKWDANQIEEMVE